MACRKKKHFANEEEPYKKRRAQIKEATCCQKEDDASHEFVPVDWVESTNSSTIYIRHEVTTEAFQVNKERRFSFPGIIQKLLLNTFSGTVHRIDLTSTQEETAHFGWKYGRRAHHIYDNFHTVPAECKGRSTYFCGVCFGRRHHITRLQQSNHIATLTADGPHRRG